MGTTLTNINEEYIPKSMHQVECTICGADDFKWHETFGYNNKFQYVKCNKCSNVFLNPRPSYDEEFVTIAYDQYGISDDMIQGLDSIPQRFRPSIDKYKVTLLELEKKFGKKGKVLDVGCGTGEFLIAAKELGWEPYGIDISGPMCEHIVKKLGIFAKAGQFHEMDLSDIGPFDVIHCSHVIEHIPFPNLWMQAFKKNLKADGVLCINVPNQYAPEKIFQRFLVRIGLRKNKWEKWRTPDHLYEPHLKSMSFLFSKNGLKIKDMYTYSSKEVVEQDLVYKFFYKFLNFGSKIRVYACK